MYVSCKNVVLVFVIHTNIYIDIYLLHSYPHAVTTITDIRLVGGRTQYEGRVEVNRSGEWYTICHQVWDIKEASGSE